MRLPNYGKNLAALERLAFTIKTILDYKRDNFKTRNLAKILRVRDGHYFAPHIVHLVELGYLSSETSGKRKNMWHTYSVKDWDGIKGYYNLVMLLLISPKNVEEKLSEIYF